MAKDSMENTSFPAHDSIDRNANSEDVMTALKNNFYIDYYKVNGDTIQESFENIASDFYFTSELSFLPDRIKQSPALDMGVGLGRLLIFLKSQGFTSLMGIDIDPVLARNAAACCKRFAIPVLHYDALKFLPSMPNHFGLITGFDIIEHFSLSDGYKLLQAIYNALLPGGIAVLRTINMANIFGGFSRYIDLTHQIGFTEHSLLQLFNIAGFSKARLHLPKWPEGHPLTEKFKKQTKIHQRLFSLSHRTPTMCYDKNIVVYGVKDERR
jgi:SAM-dependent methyltransferase